MTHDVEFRANLSSSFGTFHHHHHLRHNTILVTITIIIIIIIIICLQHAEAARSSPDIGLCESVVNNSFTYIDCLSGNKNFCCNDKQYLLRNLTRWSRRCCSEAEFVRENE